MNWGTKIFIAYGAFVALILSLVIGSVKQDFHLVTKDYYAEELVYEDRIQEIHNARQLDTPLEIKKGTDSLHISFPEGLEDMQGTIHLYRPSDSRLDKKIAIHDSPKHDQQIPTHNLKRGLWKVCVSWESAGKAYYVEQSLIL